jgi:hypothetical protein
MQLLNELLELALLLRIIIGQFVHRSDFPPRRGGRGDL